MDQMNMVFIVLPRRETKKALKEIRILCDHAMCGDRGIGESFGCELELPATIARGDDVCKIRFVRKNK